MKAIPTRARHAISNRAERGVMLTLMFKAGCQNCHSNHQPLIDTLEDRTGGWQARIPVRRVSFTLNFAPEATRRVFTAYKR